MSTSVIPTVPNLDVANDVMKSSKFDPSRFRLSQSFDAGAVSKTTTAITVRKPDRHSFFAIHPDPINHVQTMLLDCKQDREQYLIAPEVRTGLEGELTPKLLVPCISRQNNIFIWPVGLPDASGRINTWTQSALDAVRAGMEGWIRIVANMEAGGYDIFRPRVELDPPKWPNIDLEAMLATAFKHYLIESLDHPRVRALRGEV